MKKKSSHESDLVLKIFGLCIIIAPIADISLIVAFFLHKAGMGYSLFSFGGSTAAMDFMLAWYSWVLFGLGTLPYLVAFLALRYTTNNNGKAEQVGDGDAEEAV